MTLKEIDCNCNDCVFMVRDLEKRKQSLRLHEGWQRDYHAQRMSKLPKEQQKRFEFDKGECSLHYGHCDKFNKPVSFIPMVCQIETQECFKSI